MQRIVNNIFRYKTEIMGFAILLIMFFHLNLPTFYGIKNLFEIGVDIFLFIGGFTCAKSYMSSCENLRGGAKFIYLKKRLWRIVPPYLLLYTFIYGYEFLIDKNGDWDGFLANISMWKNILDNGLRMWYIPAILIMYSILPFYIDACKRWKKATLLPLFLIASLSLFLMTNTFNYFPFKVAWIRLPIFLIGINFFLWKDIEFKLNDYVVLMTAIVFSILSWGVRSFSLSVSRFCFIPVVIALIYYFDLIKSEIILKWLKVFGKMTLELYLIHEYVQRLLFEIFPIASLGVGAKAALCAIISLPVGFILAYAYHKFLHVTIYRK